MICTNNIIELHKNLTPFLIMCCFTKTYPQIQQKTHDVLTGLNSGEKTLCDLFQLPYTGNSHVFIHTHESITTNFSKCKTCHIELHKELYYARDLVH